MQHPLIVAALVAAASAPAYAEGAPVQVTRRRVPPPVIVDVSIALGPRQFAGETMESASGLAIGAKLGRRGAGAWSLVGVLEADAMARDQYISYGTWTVGMGVRWEGAVRVTAGAGFTFGTSKQIVGDYTLVDRSFTGATALTHALIPLLSAGYAKVGIAANLSLKFIDGNAVSSISAGLGVAW